MLTKLEFSGQIFEKYSNIKFHKNLYIGAKLFCADGQTNKTIILFSQFCERA